MNIPWRILGQLIRHPRRVVVTDDRRPWRGFEILAGSWHVASLVERRTSARHVGIMLPPSGLFPMSLLGVWSLGRVAVPLNYLLRPDDLQYVCDDSEIDLIITVRPLLDFIGTVPSGVDVLCLDEMDLSGLPLPRWPHYPSRDALAVLLYTSGTSGRPKGVMLSHGNLATNVAQCCHWAQFTHEDCLLGVLPQFHVFGLTILTLLPLAYGPSVVYTARFNPRKIVKMLRQYRPTAMMGIASMYGALLGVRDSTAEDWSSLQYAVSGGEPLPLAVFDGFRDRFGVTLNEGYGMTETSAVSHWCRPDEYRRGTVGRALAGVRVRIVGEDGRECARGEEGEIRLAGANMMLGYYKLPEETAAAFDEQGFLRTGDIGWEDEDGFLYITGRLKEMMIIGGENVFPREIEEVLNSHASVAASGVIGTKDETRGEVCVAFVEINDGAEFDSKEIRAHCRARLAQYKVPREVYCMDALPRNPTGKIMRRELKVPAPPVDQSA